MKVSTENDNNFGYEQITIVVDNIPLKSFIKTNQLIDVWRIYNCNICKYFISVPSMFIVSDITFEPNYNKFAESARKSLLFFPPETSKYYISDDMMGYK